MEYFFRLNESIDLSRSALPILIVRWLERIWAQGFSSSFQIQIFRIQFLQYNIKMPYKIEISIDQDQQWYKIRIQHFPLENLLVDDDRYWLKISGVNSPFSLDSYLADNFGLKVVLD